MEEYTYLLVNFFIIIIIPFMFSFHPKLMNLLTFKYLFARKTAHSKSPIKA
jgi:hypothetical protein